MVVEVDTMKTPQNWNMPRGQRLALFILTVVGTTLLAGVVFPFEVARYRNSCTAIKEARACVEQTKRDQADVFAQVEALRTVLDGRDSEGDRYRIIEMLGTKKGPDGKVNGFVFHMDKGRWLATRKGDR